MDKTANITCLEMINAAGEHLKPLIIFKDKSPSFQYPLFRQEITVLKSHGLQLTTSTNGWIDE